jgi:polysaccharide export outer membrane protein
VRGGGAARDSLAASLAAPFLLLSRVAGRAQPQAAADERDDMKRRILMAVCASLLPIACVAVEAEPETAQRTSAAGAAQQTPPGYLMGPEDVIEVFVWKEPDLSTTASVRPDGRITLPLVGELLAAGKTPQQLQQEITDGLTQFVELPVVTVMVKAINSPHVSVLGEVRKPGRYRIAQRATVLDAIALGGGFTEFAHRRDVLVLRRTPSGVRKIRVDVQALLDHGMSPLALESGDTVYVE